MVKKFFTVDKLQNMDNLMIKLKDTNQPYNFSYTKNKDGNDLYIITWYPNYDAN